MLIEHLAGYNSLDWHLCSLRAFMTSDQALLAFIVSVEKSGIILIGLPLCVTWPFFLVAFNSLSFFPWLSWNSLCRLGWPRTQKSACLCLPSAEIKGMCHHTQPTNCPFDRKDFLVPSNVLEAVLSPWEDQEWIQTHFHAQTLPQ